MGEFDPLRVNSYTTNELADMICNGVVTKEEVYASGLSVTKRPALEAELQRRKNVVIEDDEAWDAACRKDTVSGYESYLRRYDKWPPDYRGRYVADAKARLEELRGENDGLRRELFATMKAEPWIFNSSGMKSLFKGISDPIQLNELRNSDDIVSRFLASGQTISYEELIKEGIVTENITREAIEAEELTLRQTMVKDLLPFPTEKRTEVYFFGVPRCGKSSVLAGILSNMYQRGIGVYEPHYNSNNTDLVRNYYNGLIESTQQGLFPDATPGESVSFMKFTLLNNKRINRLTFVELGGEAFRRAAETGKGGRAAWGQLGAGEVLASNNRKMLIFILDYGIKKGANRNSTEIRQADILMTMLDIITHDGTGDNGSIGCTLSKVDTVAVVVTKSDLMDESDRNRRDDIAEDYVNKSFAAFMTSLRMKCKRFGINKPAGYNPYIMAFSLGKLFVGNTYKYDSKDSFRIVNAISDMTEGERGGLFGRIFG